MPREEHLNSLYQLVEAAYDEGSLTHRIVNKGGKEVALEVNFTINESTRLRDDAFKRIFESPAALPSRPSGSHWERRPKSSGPACCGIRSSWRSLARRSTSSGSAG